MSHSCEIKGISCEAKNCIYHDKSNCCTAEHIVIGQSSAKDKKETKCETFCCSNNCSGNY